MVNLDLHEYKIEQLRLLNKYGWDLIKNRNKLAIYRVASSLGHAWACYVNEDEIYDISLDEIYQRVYDKKIEQKQKYGLPMGIMYPEIFIARDVSYYDKIGYVYYEHTTQSGRMTIKIKEQCYSSANLSGLEITLSRPTGERFVQNYAIIGEIPNISLEKRYEYFSENDNEYAIWCRRHYIALRDIISAVTNIENTDELVNVIGLDFGTLQYCDCIVQTNNPEKVKIEGGFASTYWDDKKLMYIKFSESVEWEYGFEDNKELFKMATGDVFSVSTE